MGKFRVTLRCPTYYSIIMEAESIDHAMEKALEEDNVNYDYEYEGDIDIFNAKRID